MSDSSRPYHRRQVLAGLTAAVLTPSLAPSSTRSGTHPPLLRVLAMSDLHSAYERTGQLLAALEAEVSAHPVPHLIAVDGDVFEHGNVAAVRSDGAVDWALLEGMARIAPTVFNLGNHDNDITPDLNAVVARLHGLGIKVVSTIHDAQTGAPLAPPAVDMAFGRRSLRVVGLATNALNTYPKASRDQLSIPDPADWATANLADNLAGADLVMVMSHAGVAADRDILPLLPDGSLMIGGHNHLLFQHSQGRSAYVHTGSWTTAYTAAEYLSDGSVTVRSREVALDAPASPPLARLIAATLAATLTEEERTILGTSPRALSLGDTGRRVAAGLAQAAGCDAGFIGHTTLGTGVPAGPVSRHAFDSIVRFDGKLMRATVSRALFEGFMARANQDRPMPLADRSGDFLYASAAAPTADPVRIVTTDWCATNQQEYFGTAELSFEEVTGLAVKTTSAASLLDSVLTGLKSTQPR